MACTGCINCLSLLREALYRVYKPSFTTAGSFVQGVQTVFHYCGKLCTGCTNHFSLLREALYRVYEPFFTTAGSFVQGVRTVFHYCGKLCTGCTNHFPPLRSGFGGKVKKNFPHKKSVCFLFYEFFRGRPPFLPHSLLIFDR